MTVDVDLDPIADAQQAIVDANRKAHSLEAERITIHERVHAAAAELAQIGQDILTKERTFTPADQRELPKLRTKRTELQTMMQDLNSLLPQIEHEVRAAVQDAAFAHRVLAAQKFNTLAARQAEITQGIAAALQQFETSLRELLREKKSLAEQQASLKHQMGLNASIPDPEQLAKLYHRDIACVVAGGPVSPDYNAERMDWTTRALNHQGELGARG